MKVFVSFKHFSRSRSNLVHALIYLPFRYFPFDEAFELFLEEVFPWSRLKSGCGGLRGRRAGLTVITPTDEKLQRLSNQFVGPLGEQPPPAAH